MDDSPQEDETESLVYLNGTFALGLGFARMFWPTFELREGHLVLADSSRDNLREWIDHGGGDRWAVEQVINHRHFACWMADDGATDEEIRSFGERVQEIWQGKVDRDFPGERITVELYAPSEEEANEWHITVYHAK